MVSRALPAAFCMSVAACVACSVAGVAARPACAGGGPENVFLVVNAASPDSLAIANAWIAMRGIPPLNVFHLAWEGSRETIPVDAFRTEILRPILQAIDTRQLSAQIDQVVYSSDFPWRIDFAAELPPPLVGQDKFPSGSITGLTHHYAAIRAGRSTYLERKANRYWQPLDHVGVPKATRGFRGSYGWNASGRVVESGGPRYLLSTMLGVTAGTGNSVAEVVACLKSAAAADGRRPSGTIYFATDEGIRTRTRSGPFAAIAEELQRLGVQAEVFTGVLPAGKENVAGLMTGAPQFDWAQSGNSILPGAICENLTSFGGVFTAGTEQTPLSEFIRGGAAGSSGTVIEPYALQAKFPHPGIHVHYARGACLAEAFYQSLQAPYQLLVVGDPLCQPWATMPVVGARTFPGDEPLDPARALAGTVEIEPRASCQLPDGQPAAVGRFEFFIDGTRRGHCEPGQRYTLDTATLCDGHHELRVVAIASLPVETQGRLIAPFTTSNHDRRLAIDAQPEAVKVNGTVRVSISGQELEGVTVSCNGRVVGSISGGESTVEVPAKMLGVGCVTLHATGRAGSETAAMANAAPVKIDVLPVH